jgi:pimeloyl-ACP methyl ester carboxylesterase
MPTIDNRGATIHFEVFGRGFPILTFAPAGLRSTIEVWGEPSAPVNPTTELANEYQVIAMDQRNAGGRSHGPISAADGWDTYTADHVAVLDHLGIERCHLYGQCIGGSFILNLVKAQPQRVASAVLAQPIGRMEAELPPRTARFDDWAATLGGRADAGEDVLDAFYRNLYEPGFVYCVDRAFVSACRTPCLVLAGNDAAHPYAIADELARLLPVAEFVPEWKEGAALDTARTRIRSFLAAHTPAAA